MRSCVSLAIAGAGGSGVVSAGQFLLKTAGQLGYYGLAQRSFGPQIRGGESVSLLRLGTAPISCQDDSYHVVALLDVDKVLRFKDEMPLSKDSLVILPDTDIEPPAFVRQVGCRVLALPLNSLAKEIDEGQANMVITGVLAQALELPLERLEQVVADQLAHKGEAVVGAALSCIEAGIALAEAHGIQLQLAPAPREADRHWISNGNDLAGFGALNTGIRFVAAYPITPASGALEWLAPNLEKVGGDLVQAEDELASINMIIGSSFGGVPSMTATSGPGLALMTESLGLAVASETPVTILNVMRGGPSTGIPTKSEQSDLNIALHGLHGDAPHIVIGALSIADCAFSSGWGVWLAEATQSVAIVLSDQAMAQSDACIAPPALWPEQAERLVAVEADSPYNRYSITPAGISPMAIPGEPELMYTADGLEHNAHGTPSSVADDHRAQLDKRADKLAEFDYGQYWAQIDGDADAEVVLLSWGSVSGVCIEACQRLCQQGIRAKAISLRLLAPLQTEALDTAIGAATKLLVVEQSHSAQFLAWLRSKMDLPANTHSIHQPGPLPLRPGQLVTAISEWDLQLEEAHHAANC